MNRRKTTVLLVLFLLAQEFHHVILTNALKNHHDNTAVNKEKDPERHLENSDVILNVNKIDRPGPNAVNKRFVVAVLFGISVATSLANVAIDLHMKRKGCCGFYPSICRDVRSFNKLRAIVGRYMKMNNLLWRNVNVIKKWIQHGNDNNARIWLEIKRIGDLQKQIVEILSPDIIKKFNMAEMQLKQAVETNNQTVIRMSYQELSDRFDEPFNSAEDTAIRLSGITGLVGVKIATSAFKYYKIRQISKVLRSGYGAKLTKAAPAARKFFGLSKTSLNMHIKQTSKSIYKARFSGANAGRFMRGAGAVMSVVTIAMDIYSIVQKVRGCKKVRDRARKGLRDIRKAEQESRDMFNKLRRYRIELYTKGVSFIKQQLTSSDLRSVLQNFQQLASSAPKQARDFRSTAMAISVFLSRIHRANLSYSARLQTLLLVALKKMTIYYQCYLSKLQLVKYVTERCKEGAYSMGDLFHQGNRLFSSNSRYCKLKNGIPYASFNSVKEIVSKDVQEKGLNPDCIMNNRRKINDVCRYKNGGYKTPQIAAKTGLSEQQVKAITKTCPEVPLTPAKVKQICKLRKSFGASDKEASMLTGVSVALVATVKC